jgi:predicted small lipoprotein YifL
LKNQIISLALIASLAACGDGNPFETEEDTTTTEEEDTTEDTTTDEGTGIDRDGIPPGTATADPDEPIFRSEPTVDDGGQDGDGFATGLAYNSADDTFTVDNIAFDGDAPYERGVLVSSLVENADGVGEFNVYEGASTTTDPVSGASINQFIYRAVYGVSRNRIVNDDGTTSENPTTQFAIVRTGSYVGYGFGGFIYQRDNGVTLPSSLQATFRGKSAGLQDSQMAGPLRYTTADVIIDIDYDDFNDEGDAFIGDGVKGGIYNRRVFDLNGNDVTAEFATEIGETSIPGVSFEVGPDVLDTNGEILTTVFSTHSDGSNYETGTFYAIVAGDDPDEIVGVFVLEAASFDTRDTGGFIVYRDPDVQP